MQRAIFFNCSFIARSGRGTGWVALWSLVEGDLLDGFLPRNFRRVGVLSFVLTRCVRNWATAHGWMAAPDQGRHLHSAAAPTSGRRCHLLRLSVQHWDCRPVELVASSADLRVLFQGATDHPGARTSDFPARAHDDLHPIGPYFKFGVEVLAGAMLFAGGLRILDLPVLSEPPPAVVFRTSTHDSLGSWRHQCLQPDRRTGRVGRRLGVLFHPGCFRGGADQPHFFRLHGDLDSRGPAILGFLRFNFNPATIFLGDCGSLFIGFMLSALALQGMQKSPTLIAVAIPVVSSRPSDPLKPLLSVAASPVSRGRPVFTGDREHIHHKLLQQGLSHRQAVIILYAVSAIFALLSLFLLWPTGSTVGLVLAVVGIGVWIGLPAP